MRLFLLPGLISLFILGCGQTGPLYRESPDDASKAPQASQKNIHEFPEETSPLENNSKEQPLPKGLNEADQDNADLNLPSVEKPQVEQPNAELPGNTNPSPQPQSQDN